MATQSLTHKMEHLGVMTVDISPDGKYFAVAYRTEFLVEIYDTTSSTDLSKWKLESGINDHIQPILFIKWSTKNELLSCGADNNAFVVSFNNTTKKWKGSLVNITGSSLRALGTCDWSHDGTKFAIGGGTGEVYIGFFNEGTHQWDTNPVTVGNQTILSIKFHPSKLILAVTSIDEVLTIIKADLGNIQKYKRTKEASQDALDMSKNDYVQMKGWGNCLAWSPSGKTLTVAVHNSTFIKLDLDASLAVTKKYLSVSRHLPASHIFYTDEDTLVACGYDNLPLTYKNEDNRWILKGAMEKQAGGFLITIVYSAVEKLRRNEELKVKAASSEIKPEFNTLHYTNIIGYALAKAGDFSQFFTADMKGNLILWKLSEMKPVK